MNKVGTSLMHLLKDKPKNGTVLDPQIEAVFNLEKNDILLAVKEGYALVKVTKVLQTQYEPQFTKRPVRGGKEDIPHITPKHLLAFLEREGIKTKDITVNVFKRPTKVEIARQVEIVKQHSVEILKKHLDGKVIVDELAKEYGVSKHYINQLVHNKV